ncbi:sulfur oxidation c-type cytochrome SoxX [uncultured Thiothrix sp.]|uniref:sulfur oxidation c-type cytochrome SoxX n=1 Tax=uncultured Thiothrix sp. TaxID=223185 RepID=UPI00262D2ADE|nr:sulfur oxidation c-type cytochrome SoxX [uncultured Thiothrix sp.]
MKKPILASVALSILAGVTWAAGDDKAIQALVDQYISTGYQQGDKQHLERLKQDETLKICSETRNKPSDEQAKAIVEREKASIKYPEKMLGSWEKGKEVFNTGFGMRVGVIMPDKADKPRGGNCYACHAADPKEVAAGNIGSSLTGYGKARGNNETNIKYTYEKIYNSQAHVACSNMPRFGANGVLNPEQIADLVAFLIDPASPVNK